MRIVNHLPNLLTLLNLLAGSIAVIFAVQNELITAVVFVFIGIFFDFFDGLAARMLKVTGELGKQLDSLADVVTSGLVPGIVMYQLLKEDAISISINKASITWGDDTVDFLPYLGLLITLSAAYRLAKFNIDDRQSDSFIGLPTPAAALVVVSLPLILTYGDNQAINDLIRENWFLMGITFLVAILMHVNIPLFALKFNDFSWSNNKVKYMFLALTLICIIFLGYLAIPIAILLYVVISVISNALKLT